MSLNLNLGSIFIAYPVSICSKLLSPPPTVTINGVTWSTRNVNTPGTFAASPLNAGMFYQWNKKVGWSSTDPLINSNGGTTWDTSTPSGTSWASTNDPSPAGFRVPTKEEFNTLFYTTYVTHSWITCNGVTGTLFTEISTENTLFFPACGYRNYSSGALFSVGTGGRYWSTTFNSVAAFAHYFNFGSGYIETELADRNNGFSVRPVLA